MSSTLELDPNCDEVAATPIDGSVFGLLVIFGLKLFLGEATSARKTESSPGIPARG